MPLQVRQHEAFQRWEWRVERVAWVLAGAALLAAVLGLLGGPGPLSGTTSSSPGGQVRVELQRFTHLQADEAVSITVAPELVTQEVVSVEVSSSWLGSMDLRSISPEPQEQVSLGDAVSLRFAAQPGTELSVDLGYRPDALWRQRGEVRVGDQAAPITQFVYP